MENRNSEQESLSKPELDLPLPEKELSAHSDLASQGDPLRSYGRKFPFPKYVFLGIVFVILFAIVGGAYFLGRNSVFKELNPTIPAIPSPDPVFYEPTPTPDPTADWKTYKGETTYTSDGSSMFTIKYPPSWVLEKNRLHSSGKIPKEGEYIEGDIVFALGSGGRGAPPPQEQKEFPAGKFDYYWKDGMVFANLTKNNISYIFYVYGGFGEDEAKYKKIFDQMLSTFKFTDGNPTPSPDGKFCGGFAGKACPSGYTCQLDGNYPDAGGTCIIK